MPPQHQQRVPRSDGKGVPDPQDVLVAVPDRLEWELAEGAGAVGRHGCRLSEHELAVPSQGVAAGAARPSDWLGDGVVLALVGHLPGVFAAAADLTALVPSHVGAPRRLDAVLMKYHGQPVRAPQDPDSVPATELRELAPDGGVRGVLRVRRKFVNVFIPQQA